MSLPRGLTGASLAAWDQPCRYQLEVTKKRPEAGLLLMVAAGEGVRVLGQRPQVHLCPGGCKNHPGYLL